MLKTLIFFIILFIEHPHHTEQKCYLFGWFESKTDILQDRWLILGVGKKNLIKSDYTLWRPPIFRLPICNISSTFTITQKNKCSRFYEVYYARCLKKVFLDLKCVCLSQCQSGVMTSSVFCDIIPRSRQKLHADFLLGLLFNPEVGSDTFLQNVIDFQWAT
jgi:hypothetical protein